MRATWACSLTRSRSGARDDALAHANPEFKSCYFILELSIVLSVFDIRAIHVVWLLRLRA